MIPQEHTARIDATRRSFAHFWNPGYAQAAMNSLTETVVAAPAEPPTQMLARVLGVKPQDSKLVCATADGREFMLTPPRRRECVDWR